MTTDIRSAEYARALDAADTLAHFRDRFHLPAEGLYLDGNSLGVCSKDAEAQVLAALEQWRTMGIDGWMRADPPWFTIGEELGAAEAPLVGASPEEVIVTGTTTVNLHSMVSTFYQPQGARRKIVATELDFPSDIYALQSQIAIRGGDPDRDLVRVSSRDGRFIEEDDLIAALDDTVALLLVPSVLYRSGQLLDLRRLATAAHAAGALIGVDAAHSVGAVPHTFAADDVDFAFWCSYKYLNAGPGSAGALFVNRRHFGRTPGLTGWWGYHKERQFDMLHTWESAIGAGAWQISTVPVISISALRGSLKIFHEAGIENLRRKSLAMTDYMIALIEAHGLTGAPYDFSIGTPREHHRRGGHVAVEHASAAAICKVLKQRGIVPDFREPNVIRLAPIALYTSFDDVRVVVETLKDVIDSGDHLRVKQGRELVA
jgi:kynureninase